MDGVALGDFSIFHFFFILFLHFLGTAAKEGCMMNESKSKRVYDMNIQSAQAKGDHFRENSPFTPTQ